jgi:hypothetical protein
MLLFGGISVSKVRGVMEKDPLIHGRTWKQSGRGFKEMKITMIKANLS